MDLHRACRKCFTIRVRSVLIALLAAPLAAWLTVGIGQRSIAPAVAGEGDAPKSIGAQVAPVEPPHAKPLRPSQRQLALAAFIAQRWYLPGEQALALVRITEKAAARRSLDPVLVLAMIAVESGFNPEATSPAGAKGLMQVIPEFHPEKFSDPSLVFDPEANILAGTRILREYLSQYGDLTTALQRYAGAGPNAALLYTTRIYDELARMNAVIGLPAPAMPQRIDDNKSA